VSKRLARAYEQGGSGEDLHSLDLLCGRIRRCRPAGGSSTHVNTELQGCEAASPCT